MLTALRCSSSARLTVPRSACGGHRDLRQLNRACGQGDILVHAPAGRNHHSRDQLRRKPDHPNPHRGRPRRNACHGVAPVECCRGRDVVPITSTCAPAMGFPCWLSTTRPTILPGAWAWAWSCPLISGIQRPSQEAKRGSFIESGSVVGVVRNRLGAEIGRRETVADGLQNAYREAKDGSQDRAWALYSVVTSRPGAS